MKKLALALLLSGCAGVPKTAMVDGKEVPRASYDFTGQPYSVRHEGAHPKPGGPSSGLADKGGSIRGRICGMLADLEVTHKGDHLQIVGSFDNHLPAAIHLKEAEGVRYFEGNIGQLSVEFQLAPGQLQGHVGLMSFATEPVGDDFRGYMRLPGIIGKDGDQRLGIVIHGREALASMPPADQAAVLPALLTCNPGGGHYHMIEGLEVGLGGTATDRPDESSMVYVRMGRKGVAE